MSEEREEPQAVDDAHDAGRVPPDESSASSAAPQEESEGQVDAMVPEFPELAAGTQSSDPRSMDVVKNVTVTVAAELGRVTMSIGDILTLGVGSVLELKRPVSEPVEIVVDGVTLARGEVVVVDDHFAIRIKEFSSPKQPKKAG